MGFTQDAADMDETCDALLGDEILYKRAGATTYSTVMGFANVAEQALGFAEIDIQAQTRRIKVSKTQVPELSTKDRWRCSLIGDATYSMTNAEPLTAGRYWIIELQKASTNL